MANIAMNPKLSRGLIGLCNELDSATTVEQILRMPRCWESPPDVSLDHIWDNYRAEPKEIEEAALTNERANPGRGVLRKWLKRPYRKILKAIRDLFRQEK